jgi:hypothetical protein
MHTKISSIIDNLCKGIVAIKCYVLMYLKFTVYCIVNYLLRILGYRRVYDIETGIDLTSIYYCLTYVKSFGINLDIKYSKLGISRYIDDRYTRYICYDHYLSEIDNIMLSSKKYHDIKKIEIKDNGRLLLDVTKAKNNFYDNGFATSIRDMIKFYLVTSGKNLDILTKSSSIVITREFFDDDQLELVTAHEEIYVLQENPID